MRRHDLRMRLSVLALSAGLWAAPALQAQELVVGQCVPLSGSLAGSGASLALGVRVAMDEANANGGVNGQRIRLIARDDGYETARTIQCTQNLIRQDKAVALIGYAGTGNILELLNQKVLAEGPTPLIAPYTGGMPLREPYNPFIFHIRASYEDELNAIVEQVLTSGLNRVAVFYQDDAFGQSGLAGVKKALAARKLEPVAAGSYVKNTEDVDKGLASVLAGNPQAVVMVGVTRPLALFLKKLKDKHPAMPVYTLSVVDTSEAARVAGDAAARGMGVSQVVPRPFTAGSPAKVVQDYRAAMEKFAAKEPLSYASFEQYLGGRVLLDALRRTPGPVTAAGVMKALEATQLDLGGFKVAFQPNSRAGSRFVELTVTGSGGKVMR